MLYFTPSSQATALLTLLQIIATAQAKHHYFQPLQGNNRFSSFMADSDA